MKIRLLQKIKLSANVWTNLVMPSMTNFTTRINWFSWVVPVSSHFFISSGVENFFRPWLLMHSSRWTLTAIVIGIISIVWADWGRREKLMFHSGNGRRRGWYIMIIMPYWSVACLSSWNHDVWTLKHLMLFSLTFEGGPCFLGCIKIFKTVIVLQTKIKQIL